MQYSDNVKIEYNKQHTRERLETISREFERAAGYRGEDLMGRAKAILQYITYFTETIAPDLNEKNSLSMREIDFRLKIIANDVSIWADVYEKDRALEQVSVWANWISGWAKSGKYDADSY